MNFMKLSFWDYRHMFNLKIYLLLISLLGLAVPAVAEHVTLTNLSDTGTSQTFGELAQYNNSPASPQRLNATQRAFKALLTALTPAIKNLTNYTGIFAGNCSVFLKMPLNPRPVMSMRLKLAQ